MALTGRPPVPNTVPTPHIEALCSVAVVPVVWSRKCLRTNNGWKSRTTVVTAAKLLILRWLIPPEQEVVGSNPTGRTKPPQIIHRVRASYSVTVVLFQGPDGVQNGPRLDPVMRMRAGFD
jgi:hypothetical protein